MNKRVLFAELLGTAFLVATVVGSGTMAERLADGNGAIALLANSFATGAILVALIYALGPISGAHFNPAVTLSLCVDGVIRWRHFLSYAVSQFAGGVLGVIVAHAMFDLPLLQLSVRARSDPGQLISEFVATFGLIFVIHGTAKRPAAVPVTVAAYISAAYWFTASTSFANPAVTFARGLTSTFSGIRMADVAPFAGVQLVAAVAATLVFRSMDRVRVQSGDPG